MTKRKIDPGKTDPDSAVTKSSGNIFTDLGFPPGEAAVLAMRADLMGCMRLLIEARGWSQEEAAAVLGIGQSRVSDLVREAQVGGYVATGFSHS